MDKEKLENLLKELYDRNIEPGDALKALRHLPYEDLGFAHIDHHRSLRQGFPEVIYCEGKADEQVVAIIGKMREKGSEILATRASEKVYKEVRQFEPSAQYNKEARAILIQKRKKQSIGKILVATAGTSDIPVAEEAVVTAEAMGSAVDRLYDVGVAGIHRILGRKELLWEANVVVVAAGMDGALASVVGGLVDCPVVAIPTSVGYGASFGGISALLAMLNSCASGVAVVNIDNGFGGGCLAHKINNLAVTGGKK